MKTYKVINQNGLLFNQENSKRLILREQHEFVITAEDNAFEEQDILNIKPSKIRDSAEMLKFLASEYKHAALTKLFKKDQCFVFRVGLGKVKKEDQGRQYYFLCRILEDLYIYQKDDNHFPRLCKCNCVVESCVSENLKRFESVYAESLNQAASNTIMHFFSLKRSSAMNVFNEFKPVENKKNLFNIIDTEKIKSYPSLKTIIKSLINK